MTERHQALRGQATLRESRPGGDLLPASRTSLRLRILDRYVGAEIVPAFLTALTVFTFLFFIPQLARLMQLFVSRQTRLLDVIILTVCIVPGVLSFSLPVAVLAGTLLALSRMQVDGEILAWNTLRVSHLRLVVPAPGFSLLVRVVTLADTFWVSWVGVQELRSTELRLLRAQGPFEVEPRVFQESIPGKILYVEDVSPDGYRWEKVFLAQDSPEGNMEITLAQQAVLFRPGLDSLQIHFERGTTYSFNALHPEQYTVSVFGVSDLAVPLGTETGAQRPEAVSEAPVLELVRQARQGSLEAAIELHRRFAVPAACLMFGLLAFVAGCRPRRGGRGAAVLTTVVLLGLYYLVFVFGVGKARQGAFPAALGVWLANAATGLLAVVGLITLERATEAEGGRLVQWVATLRQIVATILPRSRRPRAAPAAGSRVFGSLPGFPLLLDRYVFARFMFFFLVGLGSFLVLVEVFTFFELLNDIGRHHIPLPLVGQYLFFLAPMLLYQLAPLAGLVGVLAALASMAHEGELVACRASGISLHRLSVPLLFAGLMLAVGLFGLDATILPATNQKQDALRNIIKGRPAQTSFQPRQRWIVGSDSRLYNYDLFDPDHQVLVELNLFEIDPAAFSLRRQVFARRAHWEPTLGQWVLEGGWLRDFELNRVTRFSPFQVATLAEMTEPPGYFKQEVRPSSQMNWRELGRYITHLRRAGYDAARLTVQWHRKFAFPAVAAIMVLLAIPCPLFIGARGALGGFALGLLIGMAYWGLAALFEALGAVGQLPPVIAAWAPDALFLSLGLYLFFRMPT